MTYYEILHVQPDAPAALIKASYRTLLHSLGGHPDRGGTHEQAVRLNEAYATLGDPAKRASYDRRLAAMAAAAAASGHTPGPRASSAVAECRFCRARVSATASDDPDSSCHACGSALSAVTREHVDRSTRRAVARWPRSMPMGFQRAGGKQRFTAVTEDISLNGLGFTTTLDLKVGEVLSLECRFCSAVGVVQHVLPPREPGSTRRKIGLEFMTLRIKHARGGLVSTVA